MKNPFLYAIAAVAVVNSGCATIKNPNSLVTKGEKVEVVLHYYPGDEPLPQKTHKAGATAALILPIVVDQATKFISKKLEDESKLYAASWAGAASGDKFYRIPDSQSPSKLRSIEVMRKVAGDYTAASFTFDVVGSTDGFAYQLKPVSAVVHRAKAKLRPKDNDVDVEVTLVIDAFWITAKKEVKNQTVATLKVPLKGLTLGNVNTDFGENNSSGWFTVPRSDGAGFGTFTVTAKVDETDEFGERVKAFQEVFEEHRSSLNEFIVGEILPSEKSLRTNGAEEGGKSEK